MIKITFRIDTNKVLRVTKEVNLHVGSTNQIIQIYIHPSLIGSSLYGDFILHYKNNAVTGSIPLFISPEEKESFYILEAISDSSFASVSGPQEIWIEGKTPVTTFITKPVKIHIKPMSEENKFKYTTVEADDLESKLLNIEARCKKYYQASKREREKAQKCVEMMIELLEENLKGGRS